MRRTGGGREMQETLAEKVDRRMVRRFRHVEIMNKGPWPRKVKADKPVKSAGRGMPRLVS